MTDNAHPDNTLPHETEQPVAASYLVRVHLREHLVAVEAKADGEPVEIVAEEVKPPTIAEVNEAIRAAFPAWAATAYAERIDR